jgi:hypothetical protein
MVRSLPLIPKLHCKLVRSLTLIPKCHCILLNVFRHFCPNAGALLMEVIKTFYSVRGFQWHRVMDVEVMQQIAYRLCFYASGN